MIASCQNILTKECNCRSLDSILARHSVANSTGEIWCDFTSRETSAILLRKIESFPIQDELTGIVFNSEQFLWNRVAFTIHAMDIAALLRPYIEDLSAKQAQHVADYLDILLRWNARMNLTAIRDPAQIAIRHFGESFFLAAKCVPAGPLKLADVGSGAGFPGIPIKIVRPEISLTLIEAQQRKAVFLKEVLRTLNLDGEVKNVRVEQLTQSEQGSYDFITFRAVEKFDSVLPLAARLVAPKGELGILIGRTQVVTAQNLLKTWKSAPFLPVPGSENRGILVLNQDS